MYNFTVDKHEASAVPVCHTGTVPTRSPRLTPRLSNTGL